MTDNQLTPAQGELLAAYNDKYQRVQDKMNITMDPWRELADKINEWKTLGAALINSLVSDKKNLLAQVKKLQEELSLVKKPMEKKKVEKGKPKAN